jgi:hypothetical protein
VNRVWGQAVPGDEASEVSAEMGGSNLASDTQVGLRSEEYPSAHISSVDAKTVSGR